MPYIPEEQREFYKPNPEFTPSNAGQLNFSIICLCNEYKKFNGESYRTYNDIIGALECCKQEMYRRLIAPYEDQKIKQNGDVF